MLASAKSSKVSNTEGQLLVDISWLSGHVHGSLSSIIFYLEFWMQFTVFIFNDRGEKLSQFPAFDLFMQVFKKLELFSPAF